MSAADVGLVVALCLVFSLASLAFLAVGAVLGGMVVHLRHRQARATEAPPGPTVEVDEAMAHAALADLVGVLERLGPTWVRSVVDDMSHVDVLRLYLQAAIMFMVTSPEVPPRLRSTADALLAAESWSMPAAERPDDAGGTT